MKTFGISERKMFCLLAAVVLQAIHYGASDSLECLLEYQGACTLETMRSNDDSWIDELKAILASDAPAVTIIKRCQLFNRTPVHKLLVQFSQLFDHITLQQYHEQFLTITNHMSCERIDLLSAPLLMDLTILPNRHLRSLHIVDSVLERIPRTITMLKRLEFLGIDRAKVRILDLGLMCALPELQVLQLDRNNISLLLPAPNASCLNSLRELFLDHNQLTALDLALFAPFVYLERLFVQHNGLHSITCSNLTHFPHLNKIGLGPGNNLAWVALKLLQLSAPVTISMPDNQLKQLPYLNPNNVLQLIRVYYDGNKLTAVNLAQFKPHQHLDSIHLDRNQLSSISCRQYVHLPVLVIIDVSHNLLESFSLENCNFPQLRYISFLANRFKRIPADICFSEVAPLPCGLGMEKNPLQCSSLLQYKPLLTIPTIDYKLTVTMATSCTESNYTGHIPVSHKYSACCML